jgi:hypothetical protein
MGAAAKYLLASCNSATWFAGVALLGVAFLVIAVPGVSPVDAGRAGVTLIGP